MTDIAFAVSARVSAARDLPLEPEPTALLAGDKIGPVHVAILTDKRVEIRVPGELGWGRALVGLVPIVWCAAAWTLCLREHLLAERLKGCVALSLMAAVSAILMASSLGVVWRFDGKRRRIVRRVGLLDRSHNGRRIASLRVESTRPSAVADVQLRMTLVDATGGEQFEIATWSRREIDRAQVDALAAAIRGTMGWSEALSN
jgi:hypothetical protein